jgi:NitT/TauT family transport system substrate-binding protein
MPPVGSGARSDARSGDRGRPRCGTGGVTRLGLRALARTTPRPGGRVPVLRMAGALFAVALLVSACHVPGTASAGGSSSGGQTVTVAVVSSVANAPLRLGVKDKLFSKHGLNVKIDDVSSTGQAIRALRSGQAQFAGGDYTDFFYQQSLFEAGTGRLNFKLVADGYDAAQSMLEILSLPRSGITAPQDLVGKTVATPARVVFYPPTVGGTTSSLPYNIETLATQTVLEADGVSPSAVTWQPTPVQDMISELRSHQVSAILAPEPYVFQAEAQLGAQEVLDSCSGATAGLPLAGYFSLARYANANASTVADFQAGLAQAQSDAAMRGAIDPVLPSAMGGATDISATDASLITLGTYPTSLSVGQVQRVVELMFQTGMIGSTLNVRQLVAG